MRLTSSDDLAQVAGEWSAVAGCDLRELSDEVAPDSGVELWAVQDTLPRIARRLSALTAPAMAIDAVDLRFTPAPLGVLAWCGDVLWVQQQHDLPWSPNDGDIAQLDASEAASQAEAVLADWNMARALLRTVSDDAAIKYIRLHHGQQQADTARQLRDLLAADVNGYEANGLAHFHTYTQRLRVAVNAALDATHNTLAAAPAPRLITRSIR